MLTFSEVTLSCFGALFTGLDPGCTTAYIKDVHAIRVTSSEHFTLVIEVSRFNAFQRHDVLRVFVGELWYLF